MQLILFIALLLLTGNCQFHYNLYSKIKPNVKFPTYTPEQRLLVAQQASYLFDIYANKQSKLENYGVNAAAEIIKILNTAESMNDTDFHTAMSSLFLSLRDLHTDYTLPFPYYCYQAVFPLQFSLVESEDIVNNPVVVVESFASPEILKFTPEIKDKVKIGDILVSINGKSFKEIIQEKLNSTSNGANHFGGQRNLLNYLSLRSGTKYLLPEETEVTYELRNANSEVYSITTPIVGGTNNHCEAPPTISKRNQLASEENSDLEIQFSNTQQLPPEVKYQLTDMKNEEFIQILKLFNIGSSVKLTPTKVKFLSFSKFQYQNSTIGIIKLREFASDSILGIDGTVRLIRSLLLKELQDTDALIFDVRNNPGGKIDFADAIPLLFSRNAKPTQARAVVHPINKDIFLGPNFVGTDWYDAYSNVKEGDKYTQPKNILTPLKWNDYGEAYFKPVGVLTNANCYSACDMFAANMQDSAAAKIYGEDATTGAGGANVVIHDSYLRAVSKKFQQLPNYQDFRVGWRQTVRTGKNSGKLVEDIGVLSDMIVRPVATDFYEDKEVNSQLLTIAADLLTLSQKEEVFIFSTIPQLELDAEIGSVVPFEVSFSRLTKLTLLDSMGTVTEQDFPSGGIRKAILATQTPTLEKIWSKYTILGTLNDKQFVKTNHFVRYIPKKSDFLKLESTVVWDPNNAPYSGIYNRMDLPSSSGWNFLNGKVVIGNGINYENNVNSAITFFLNIPFLSPAPGCVNPYSEWAWLQQEPAWEKISKQFFNTKLLVSDMLIYAEDTYLGPFYDLAREWVAIHLNVANGALLTPLAQRMLHRAYIILRNYHRDFSNVTLEFQVEDNNEIFSIAKIINILQDFNNGITGPQSCLSSVRHPKIYIDAVFETEKEVDFLNLKVFHPKSGIAQNLWNDSGNGKVKGEFQLSDDFSNSNGVEVTLSFTSDSQGIKGSVVINRIELRYN
ncbi:hypothetical protein HDU92_008800 [Lobulomyces angularis]|nr:hypothetical protein HDU92_008800 [Lobulomyces angularis]